MNDAPDVAELLRGARRRVMAQGFVGWLGMMLMAGAGVMVAMSAVERWMGVTWWRMEWPAAIGGLAVAGALGVAWWRAPGLPRMAAGLDRAGRMDDRLTTALAFAEGQGEAVSPMRALALRECGEYLRGRDFRGLLPWRMTVAWRWMLVPVIALGLVRWDLHLAGAERARLAEAGTKEVEPTVEALKKMAREMAAAAEKAKDPELKKLAEELARRAEELRMAATNPAEAQKAALRELSALEQLAQEMQRKPSPGLTPEELKALAAALEKAEATQAAAEKLKAGEVAEAADELERAAGDQAEAARTEAALREALDRLAEQQQLSEATQKQLAPAPGSAAESALKQLADLLRKMPASKGGKPGEQKSSPQSLESLLAALQNLKAGEGKPGEPKPGMEGGGPPPRTMEISPAPPGGNQSASAQIPVPGGNPGGEKDAGTTDSPFGPGRQEGAKKGADLALQGQQTDKGDSYSQMLPGGTDASRASRRYKELYETMAPAAENAVVQEDIPLGSRLFIKRYFEAIRPTR